VRRPRRTTPSDAVVPATPAPGPPPPNARGASAAQLLDAAVTVPSAIVRTQVDRLRARHPHASPEQIIGMLERRYLLTVTSTGGAVGAAAAFPSVGTGTALALTTSQVGTFLAASAALALAVADVHGVEVDDVPRRRTLVLASLLGEQGSVIVEEEVGVGTLFWARSLLTKLPLTTVRTVNRTLARRMARYAATRGSAVFIGRLAPFGIGAVIGWTGARAMGSTMITGVRRAFGPPPESFSRPPTVGDVTAADGPAGVIGPGSS
jgi:hypothetical protein